MRVRVRVCMGGYGVVVVALLAVVVLCLCVCNECVSGTFVCMLLKQDGTVWTAGVNNNGQLGWGTATSSEVFVQVQGVSGQCDTVA